MSQVSPESIPLQDKPNEVRLHLDDGDGSPLQGSNDTIRAQPDESESAAVEDTVAGTGTLPADRLVEDDVLTHETKVEQELQALLEKYPTPAELKPDQEGRNPEERASICSILTYSFVGPLVSLGYARTLTKDDIPKVKVGHSALVSAPHIAGYWEQHLKRHEESELKRRQKLKPGEQFVPKEPSLARALLASMGWSSFVIIIAQALMRVEQIFEPILIEKILRWLADPTQDEKSGYLYGMALALMMLAFNLLNERFFFQGVQMYMRIRAGLCAMIYTKALKIVIADESPQKPPQVPPPQAQAQQPGQRPAPAAASAAAAAAASSQGLSMGQIVNLMSVDTEKIGEACYFGWSAIFLPVQLAIILWLLYDTIGASMFVGFGILVVMVTLAATLMSKFAMFLMRKLGASDRRVKLTNEVLQGIRIVKLYAWEYFFRDKLNSMRADELDALFNMNWFAGLMTCIFFSTMAFFTVATFSVYSALHDNFSPATVFKAVAYFNALQSSVMQLPNVVNGLASGSISAQRIKKFLMLPELESLRQLDVTRPLLHRKREYLLKKRLEGHVPTDALAEVRLQSPALGSDRDLDAEARELDQMQDSILHDPVNELAFDKPTNAANAVELHQCSFTWRSVRLALDTLAPESAATPPTSQVDMSPSSPSADIINQPTLGEIPRYLGDLTEEQRARLDKLPLVLKNINFQAAKGKITAIVGPVGSGKSSLIAGILGELDRVRGEVARDPNSRFAYVAQTAWIQTTSLQKNITFGEPITNDEDRSRYERILDACALRQDIAQFEAGDQTEIGDRGINLSGGQKQRVAIARALYSNADVFIFDDPLSAVDAHVAEHIFSECVEKELAGKTRIIVLNQLHLLPRCDYIYVLSAPKAESKSQSPLPTEVELKQITVVNPSGQQPSPTAESKSSVSTPTSASGPMIGYVVEHGTYSQLTESSHHFNQMMRTYRESLEKKAASEPKDPSNPGQPTVVGPAEKALEQREPTGKTNSALVETKNAGQLSGGSAYVGGGKLKKGQQIQTEEIVVGHVPWKLYWWYVRNMGLTNFLMTLFFTLVSQGAMAWLGMFLGYWVDDRWNKSHGWYRTFYFVTLAVSTVAMIIRARFYARATAAASTHYHGNMIDRVLRASSAFFDVTPSGRILNRFSKDLDAVDTFIPLMGMNLITISFSMLSSMIVCAYSYPWFTIPLVVMFIVFVLLQTYYSPAAVQIQRIESVARSPLYQHFTESLRGISTIRAFGRTGQFQVENVRRIDEDNSALYWLRMVYRWGSLRVSLIQFSLLTIAIFLVVSSRGNSAIGLSGVVLTYMFGFSGMIGFLVMMTTELSARMNSIERLQYYIDGVPQEPSLDEGINGYRPPADWPSKGVVEYHNVKMRYRPELPPVLHNLSFGVNAGEKIGVVGRTGSGKSSLMVLLMRLYEIERGSITIDGVNIRNLALHDLRSKIGIVPQDPVLFSGTLRSNLDPFGHYTDEQIMAALQNAGLGDYVESVPGKLESPVQEFGANLSQGQRQLICLARVLLKNPKILLLDEATSSVDSETDALLQKAISERFPSTTQLTIAHRLNTVMNSDRILVMESGNAVEFDSPHNLLQKQSNNDDDSDASGPHSRRANFADLYRSYIENS